MVATTRADSGKSPNRDKVATDGNLDSIILDDIDCQHFQTTDQSGMELPDDSHQDEISESIIIERVSQADSSQGLNRNGESSCYNSDSEGTTRSGSSFDIAQLESTLHQRYSRKQSNFANVVAKYTTESDVPDDGCTISRDPGKKHSIFNQRGKDRNKSRLSGKGFNSSVSTKSTNFNSSNGKNHSSHSNTSDGQKTSSTNRRSVHFAIDVESSSSSDDSMEIDIDNTASCTEFSDAIHGDVISESLTIRRFDETDKSTILEINDQSSCYSSDSGDTTSTGSFVDIDQFELLWGKTVERKNSKYAKVFEKDGIRSDISDDGCVDNSDKESNYATMGKKHKKKSRLSWEGVKRSTSQSNESTEMNKTKQQRRTSSRRQSTTAWNLVENQLECDGDIEDYTTSRKRHLSGISLQGRRQSYVSIHRRQSQAIVGRRSAAVPMGLGQLLSNNNKEVERMFRLTNEDCDGLKENDDEVEKTMVQEMCLIASLALSNMCIECAGSVPFILTVSFIGRNYAPIYLEGFSLAFSVGNISINMLMLGIFSASDTLQPQAFGAENYNEVGVLALRGLVVAHAIIIPISAILLFFIEPLLLALRQPVESIGIARDWFRIYSIMLPLTIIAQVIWKFLSAQCILRPVFITSIISAVVLTPLFLWLFDIMFGFMGTAIQFIFVVLIQVIVLLAYLKWKKPYNAETWTGFTMENWNLVFDKEKLWYFVKLSLGGLVASFEWFYWEVVVLLVGTLGTSNLSIHAIAMSTGYLSYCISCGVMFALSTRIGNLLPVSASKAKRISLWGAILSTIVFLIECILMYSCRRFIISLFTSDEAVAAGCDKIWFDVVMLSFTVSIFFAVSGIATALAMQWTLGVLTVMFLFGVGIPLICYTAIVPEDGNIGDVWKMMWPPYCGVSFVTSILIYRSDWEQVAVSIRIREGMIIEDTTTSRSNEVHV